MKKLLNSLVQLCGLWLTTTTNLNVPRTTLTGNSMIHLFAKDDTDVKILKDLKIFDEINTVAKQL